MDAARHLDDRRIGGRRPAAFAALLHHQAVDDVDLAAPALVMILQHAIARTAGRHRAPACRTASPTIWLEPRTSSGREAEDRLDR